MAIEEWDILELFSTTVVIPECKQTLLFKEEKKGEGRRSFANDGK